jgi:hypothetical protein
MLQAAGNHRFADIVLNEEVLVVARHERNFPGIPPPHEGGGLNHKGIHGVGADHPARAGLDTGRILRRVIPSVGDRYLRD